MTTRYERAVEWLVAAASHAATRVTGHLDATESAVELTPAVKEVRAARRAEMSAARKADKVAGAKVLAEARGVLRGREMVREP